MKKTFFLSRQRCEARCFVGRWGGGGGDGRHLCLLPSQCGQKVCEILPKYFASQQRLFCSGMPFIIASPHPTHCLLVLPRQSIYHQPPIHHRIFFLYAFNCVKVTLLSNPATMSLNQLCAYLPTNSLHNWLVPSNSWRFTLRFIVKIIYLLCLSLVSNTRQTCNNRHGELSSVVAVSFLYQYQLYLWQAFLTFFRILNQLKLAKPEVFWKFAWV